MLAWVWLSAVVLALDQATKALASRFLPFHEPVSLVPFVNLTLTHNTGAAFSLLHRAGGWQRWLFAALAVAVSIAIVVWLKRLPRHARWTAAALGLVLGGALGNLWDRLAHGYVVDFIDLYYRQWHWPAFNVADSAITLGAVMLVAEVVFARSR